MLFISMFDVSNMGGGNSKNGINISGTSLGLSSGRGGGRTRVLSEVGSSWKSARSRFEGYSIAVESVHERLLIYWFEFVFILLYYKYEARKLFIQTLLSKIY